MQVSKENLTDGRRVPPIKHRRMAVERRRTAFDRYPTYPIRKRSNVGLRPFYDALRQFEIKFEKGATL